MIDDVVDVVLFGNNGRFVLTAIINHQRLNHIHPGICIGSSASVSGKVSASLQQGLDNKVSRFELSRAAATILAFNAGS